MAHDCIKSIRIPCRLKAQVERLARSNEITSSELIRLSIETKLPEYETGNPPLIKEDNDPALKTKGS